MKAPLTANRLREILHYEPATGTFTRLVYRSSNAKSGQIVGSPDKDGYLRFYIDGRLYGAHRLAWLYVFGEWPSKDLDHINRIKADNRIANLREVSHSENLQNTTLCSRNKSGFKGVSWYARTKRWVAHIKSEGRTKHLGYFDTPELAFAAYCDAAKQLHTHNPVLAEPA